MIVYTPEIIRYVQAHWNTDMRGPDIAEQIGTRYENLKAAVDRLRRKGYQFAERSHPVGTVKVYKQGSGTVKRIKTESGWTYLSSDGRTYKASDATRERDRIRKRLQHANGQRRIDPAKPKAPAPKIVTKSIKKAPKPQPQPIKRTSLTTAEKLELGYRWVWLNSKTKVLRSPDKLA